MLILGIYEPCTLEITPPNHTKTFGKTVSIAGLQALGCLWWLAGDENTNLSMEVSMEKPNSTVIWVKL